MWRIGGGAVSYGARDIHVVNVLVQQSASVRTHFQHPSYRGRDQYVSWLLIAHAPSASRAILDGNEEQGISIRRDSRCRI